MKVYRKVVIDICTMEDVYEDSFEYNGDVAQCGGGGAIQSAVPTYVDEVLDPWLRGYEDTGRSRITQNMTDLMNNVITNSENPYYGFASLYTAMQVYPYSPTNEINDIETAYEGAVSAANSIVPTTNIDSFVGSILSTLASRDVISEDDLTTAIATIVSAVIAYANSEVATGMDATRLAIGTTALTTIEGEVKSDVTDLVDSAITAAGTALSTLFTTIESRLETPIDSMVDAALTKATAALSGTPISDAVAAFESSQAIRFAREKSRFTSGLADANSVNASTFVFGLALLEAERSREVDKFEADMKLQVHRDAYLTYIQTFQSALKDYISVYITDITEFMKSVNVNMPVYSQIYRDVAQRHADTYIETFRSRLSAFMQEKMRYNTGRDEFIRKGVSDIANLTQVKMQGKIAAYHDMLEGSRIAYVMNQEYVDRSVAYVSEAQRWPLAVYQAGANMLASGAGAAVLSNVPEPSKAQSVLGGAAQGAAIGAMISKTPYGAGIGAVVGGIAGLIK